MIKIRLLLFLVLPCLALSFNQSFAQSNNGVRKYLSGDTPAQLLSYPEKIPVIAGHQNSNKTDNLLAVTKVTIIESESYNSLQVMDNVWKSAALAEGYSANILSQSALNDTSFFAITDILIISSGLINLTDANYAILMQYLKSGRSAYLQCEYLKSYPTNIYFQKLVDTLGGSFNWISELSGDLAPVTVLGTLSTTPYHTTSLSYFWYGVSGGGDWTITNFLVSNGQYIGFAFDPTNTNYGELITTSDQDWINQSRNDSLMKNILYSLKIHSHPVAAVKKVSIIESESFNPQHVMDNVWKSSALAEGYSANIFPQSALNDTSFFAITDILIISSGAITLTDANYATIISYLKSGRSAYLQCEYLKSFATNIYFEKLVDTLGGSFNWISELSGDLSPVTILGSLSTTPYNTTTLSYFWYGVSGGGDGTITNFLVSNGQYLGFVFNPPNTNYGELITTSDQDWVNQSSNDTLMKNIIYSLRTHNHTVGVAEEENVKIDYKLNQNYPNPFNPSTTINYQITKPGLVTLRIYDILGREVAALVNENKIAGSYNYSFNASGLPSGVYIYQLKVNDYVSSRKMILLK